MKSILILSLSFCMSSVVFSQATVVSTKRIQPVTTEESTEIQSADSSMVLISNKRETQLPVISVQPDPASEETKASQTPVINSTARKPE